MGVKEINIKKPDENVISLLEKLTEEAKRGEIQSVALVLSYGNYLTGNAWAGMGKNNMAIVGEIVALQHEFLNGEFVQLRNQPICYE